MNKITHNELLEAGVHFGHLKRKWNPKISPFIFMERKGIHIIDLNRTIQKMEQAAAALKQIASSGRKILFVATKKQGKSTIEKCAARVNMPYVTERWFGGLLTNFATIRRSVKKMESYDKMEQDGTFENITKKERLRISREKAKMRKAFNGIADLNRLPSALYVVDILHEHNAIAEAKKLNITTFAMIDTNADPNTVDFPIPANDDAAKAIEIVTTYLTNAIEEGLAERKKEKEAEDKKKDDEKPTEEKEATKEQSEVKKTKQEKPDDVKEKVPAKEEKKTLAKAATKKTTNSVPTKINVVASKKTKKVIQKK